PLAGILPGTVSAGSGPTAGVVTWQFPGPDAGTIRIALGWDAGGPTATVGIDQLKFSAGALVLSASAGYAAGSIAVSSSFGVDLTNALGISVTPTIALSESGGAFHLSLYPLATNSGNGSMS